jgi:hypothetical protein
MLVGENSFGYVCILVGYGIKYFSMRRSNGVQLLLERSCLMDMDISNKCFLSFHLLYKYIRLSIRDI